MGKRDINGPAPQLAGTGRSSTQKLWPSSSFSFQTKEKPPNSTDYSFTNFLVYGEKRSPEDLISYTRRHTDHLERPIS